MSKDIESAVRPAHYNSGDISCIDAMIAAFGVEEVRIWCKITAFKYVWRMGKKDAEEQEVGKTKWYLDKFVELTNEPEPQINKPEPQIYTTQNLTTLGGFKIGDAVLYARSKYAEPTEEIIDDIIVKGEIAIIHFESSSCCTGKNIPEIQEKLKHI